MLCHLRVFINITSAIFIFCSCTTTKSIKPLETKVDTVFAKGLTDNTKTSPFLDSLLKQYPQYFDTVIRHKAAMNVQVIYTQINRDANGLPNFKHHFYNVDPANYFYPASTVKFPIVLLALQKLNGLKGKGIDKNTTMITETAFSGQTAVYNDPTVVNGKPSIAQYIKKILMVSDNDAYNRLYEFLGQDYINEQLHKKGYEDAQILHRLNIFLTEEENRNTNPVTFLDAANNVLYTQPAQRNNAKYSVRNDSIGNAFIKSGQLVNGPMNFSGKNRISLEDLHTILINLVFPTSVSGNQGFNLTESDKDFVMKYMSQTPEESVYPDYASDTVNYWPAYCKFLLFGAEKGKLPKHIRIFNKPGDAYGHLSDIAFITDLKNNIEFFVSAEIYCNSDGILNDDKYDYQNIGLPFMKHLGEVLYQYELKRERTFKPDLTPFIFKYDK